MASSLFSYDDLPLEHHDSIRLLEIEPHSAPDRLQVRLKCMRLSEVRSRYKALSYMWRQESGSKTIDLNGRELTVGATIYNFLDDLRQPLEPGALFWTDAICINQHSNAEKGHQVRMMSRIYSLAKETVIWLGNSRRDRHAMQRFGLSAHESRRSNVCPTNEYKTPTNRSMRRAGAYLAKKQYWRRVWIIQELRLAQSVSIRCGGNTFSGSRLSSLHKSLSFSRTFLGKCVYLAWRFQTTRLNLGFSRRWGISTHPESFWGRCVKSLYRLDRHQETAQYLRALTSRLGSSDTINFCGLLGMYIHADCSLPRDRVFALLGLITDENDPLFQNLDQEHIIDKPSIVDYDVRAEALFLNIIRLYTHGVLSILTLIMPLYRALEPEFDQQSLKEMIPVDCFRLHKSPGMKDGSNARPHNQYLSFFDERPDTQSRDEVRLSEIVMVCDSSEIKALVFRTSNAGRLLELAAFVGKRHLPRLQTIINDIVGSRFELSHDRNQSRIKLSLHTIRAFSKLARLIRSVVDPKRSRYHRSPYASTTISPDYVGYGQPLVDYEGREYEIRGTTVMTANTRRLMEEDRQRDEMGKAQYETRRVLGNARFRLGRLYDMVRRYDEDGVRSGMPIYSLGRFQG